MLNSYGEIDYYFLLLSEEMYNEFKNLGMECNDFLMKSKIDKFKLDNGFFTLELNKTEYCLLLLHIRQLSRKSSIILRMLELGRVQDVNFQTILDRIDYESKRLSLFDH